MKHNFNKKVAFTLAELLITLGIIGVVAALTLPTLLKNNAQKQTVVKVQRALAEMNQAYRLSSVDNGVLSKSDTVNQDPVELFNTYLKPYFKVAKFCDTYSDCGYLSSTPYFRLSGEPHAGLIHKRYNILFESANGFYYLIQTRGAGSESFVESFSINVDINGAKKPNQLGKDIFLFCAVNGISDSFAPCGSDKTDEEINDDCQKDGFGLYCAEKIRRDGWKISKDYPW